MVLEVRDYHVQINVSIKRKHEKILDKKPTIKLSKL